MTTDGRSPRKSDEEYSNEKRGLGLQWKENAV